MGKTTPGPPGQNSFHRQGGRGCIFKGIYLIVSTPFLDQGEIDYFSIERLVEFMAQKKVHGLAILGALGEGHKLTDQERTEVIAKNRCSK